MRSLQSRSVPFNTEMNQANKTPPVPSLDNLPDSAMIRAGQLITRPGRPGLFPFGSTTLWRQVKAGQFPKPVKLFGHVTAWKVGDVRAWMAQREGKATP